MKENIKSLISEAKSGTKILSDSILIKQIIKNYIILIIGLFIMSLGVALSVISDLGTTPIACIPNVIKYSVSLSMGLITILFNLFLILIQVLILKSEFEKKNYLQILVSIIFGYFIDLGLYILSEIIPKKLFSKMDNMYNKLHHNRIRSIYRNII